MLLFSVETPVAELQRLSLWLVDASAAEAHRNAMRIFRQKEPLGGKRRGLP
jgi:hypothetical protein